MGLKVIRWEAAWGPVSEQTMRRQLAAAGYRVSAYCYPPGTCFPPHRHAVHKRDAVLAGKLKISWPATAGSPAGSVVLEAGDMIEIPAGAEHSAEVVGPETVFSLDATKAP
ncbi:MAG TPA: cupin domain-containing protein [Terriglobia bacterium]|nr:cupin domain-containing protein [Terriglobia bacterium]